MTGIKGQEWGVKHGQKIHVGARIEKELKKKLDEYIKVNKIKNTSQGVAYILKEYLK